MKNTYKNLNLEIIDLSYEDIIITSDGEDDIPSVGGGVGDDQGDWFTKS